MKVFLVEDSPLVLARLRELLSSLPDVGIVGEAAGASEAIAGILASEPDIALLDLNLKEGSGFDVLRALGGRMPRTRFYMLSNFSAYPYRQLALRLGARDFLDKTKDIERVSEIMQGREPCLQSSC